MSELSRKLMEGRKGRGPKDGDRKSDRARDDELSPHEQRAFEKIQKEAKAAGSFLTSGGKGGLPPSLVLGVFRRDRWRCKSCGALGDEKQNGGIGVHHKGGIVDSEWLSKKGHHNDPNNLVTICNKDHDREHEKARKEGTDSSQVTPSGDRGNPRRDKGLPPAKVDR